MTTRNEKLLRSLRALQQQNPEIAAVLANYDDETVGAAVDPRRTSSSSESDDETHSGQGTAINNDNETAVDPALAGQQDSGMDSQIDRALAEGSDDDNEAGPQDDTEGMSARSQMRQTDTRS